MINKNFYRKTNDKKILHKVGKQWKVVSVALLMAIGGGAAVAATNNNANADVNVNDATQVNNEATELENDTFNKPASASASSSAASKSTAAPSLASYSYAPSARVSGHNADAAYYNNHYDFDQQEVSYYGPTVKNYVNSINARFPEAKNLQNSYNSASTSAIDAKSAAKSYANAAATPANGSIINAMAAKAGLTSSDFISSVKAATLHYSSQVSEGSAENSAIGFVNSLVNEVLNGNPSQSANNAYYAARTASANYQSASAVSSADQRNISAVNSANAKNENALDDAINASQNASENANVARIYSGIDIDTTNSAARVASGISAGSSVNSSAMSNAISSAARHMNLSASTVISELNYNSVEASSFVSSVFSYASSGATNTNVANYSFFNKLSGIAGTHYSITTGDNNDLIDNAMAADIADTAAQSAQTSVSASAAVVIASAKAYKSAHANDLSSASNQARNDRTAVSSAYNAYEMAMANNLISSTIASGVGQNGSNAVGYLNGLLSSADLAAYFGGIAETDTSSYQDFAGNDTKASLFNSMLSNASASNSAATANYSTASDAVVNEDNSLYAANLVNKYLINTNLNTTVSNFDSIANNNNVAQGGLKDNSSASALFNNLFKSAGFNATDETKLDNDYQEANVDEKGTFANGGYNTFVNAVAGNGANANIIKNILNDDKIIPNSNNLTDVKDALFNAANDLTNNVNTSANINNFVTGSINNKKINNYNGVINAFTNDLSDQNNTRSLLTDTNLIHATDGMSPAGLIGEIQIAGNNVEAAYNAIKGIHPTNGNATQYGFDKSGGHNTTLMTDFINMSNAASNSVSSDTTSLIGNNSLESKSQSASNSATSASNEFNSLSTAYTQANSNAASAFDILEDAAGYNNKTDANNALSNVASSAFESAALASGSAEGVDFSILSAGSGQSAYSEYGNAVTTAEKSLNTNTGASHVALGTSANLSSAMSLAESSANSSYDSVVSASAKYSGDEDVNVTLASYFASSYTSNASSEATLANSASSALNSLYLDKADSATASAYTDYYSALNAENGNKTLAHANGIFVLHNSPQFITLTKNAELHDAVLFNKKTALRSAKAGEQFAVKGVAFDKVGTLRYVVGTTKDGGYVYVTANDNYVENSYLEPDANYTVKLLHGANVHATKNFSSKVIKHLPAGTEFTGQAVPTLNVDHTYNYYYGVSRLAAFGGYVTANVNVVQNMPQNNNNNNNSSAASNNQKPAGNPANLVLFK